ncbi:PP2C family protein-serine/threonine phosphatase [Nocardioides ungokensis]
MIALVVIDLLAPLSVIPDVLFGMAPLIACAFLSPRVTTLFGTAAVALTVWSGWLNGVWDQAQQWVRLVDVVLIGAAGTAISVVRERREGHLARVTAIAETAQRAILPKLPSTGPNLATAARYLSAATDALVGGDLYDCSLVDGSRRFIVADVRGKGIESVEQAARVIRAFRQAAAVRAGLDEVAEDMNRYLTPFLGEEEFVTAVLVDVSDPEAVVLTSCGHPPALLARADGEAFLVEVPPGLPLGIGPGFSRTSVPWQPGDRLLIYTDGLSEARDAQGEFLPLLDLAPDLTSGTLDGALDRLLERVRRHVPGGALADDLAVVLLEHTGTSATQRLQETARESASSVPLLPLDLRPGDERLSTAKPGSAGVFHLVVTAVADLVGTACGRSFPSDVTHGKAHVTSALISA